MKKRSNPIRSYHASFHGDTYGACSRCGGRCEKYKTSTLVPGEKRYIAASLGVTVSELERQYLDRLDTPYGQVDVIRLGSACSFLGDDKRCSIVEAKPILCDCYPIVLLPSRGKPRFGVDRRGCPMARWPAYRSCIEEFVERGVPALAQLRLDAAWRKIVALYDEFDFDCEAIGRGLERETPGGPVMVEELLAFARSGGERKARSRGLKLLAIRLDNAMNRELATFSRYAKRRAALRIEVLSYAAALRRSGRAMRGRLAEVGRDRDLFSEPGATRYLRLVREMREKIRGIARDARNFTRRLERRRPVRSSQK